MDTCHVQFLDKLIKNFNTNPLILAGDFNARSQMWFENIINQNGRRLQPIIDFHNMLIHNNRNKTCRGLSIIDLTITNSHAHVLVNGRKTLNLSLITDHHAISFDISLETESLLQENNSTWYFQEKRANWQKYEQAIKVSRINEATMKLGKGPFLSFLFKLNVINDPTCECRLDAESPEHLLLTCPLTNQISEEVHFDKLKDPEAWQIDIPYLNNYINPYTNIIESRKLAIQRTNDRHDKEKIKYDNKHKNPHFDTGDLVLVKAYRHPNSGLLGHHSLHVIPPTKPSSPGAHSVVYFEIDSSQPSSNIYYNPISI
ncbi:hypothetical protein LAZ67_21001704 [Cordylochernes scorpioides]|uniref:Endonuclease/exonuclease/phosphatase domain-containing protein n=1 Tax=Cordylochernes scorpioides TaxID=51811 RepID=A0ABY6LQ90_9ARAC|nr:hypothetical protein LAZ67_21001704 [Cordylochernes scorpioides]